jgi:Big-like domain-containing protein
MRNGTAVRAILGVALGLGACSGSDTGTAPTGPEPGSTTVLESVTPAAGATEVSPAGTMTIRFSGPMAAGMQQYVDLHRGDVAGPIVPTSCTMSADLAAITCTPDQPLEQHTRYTLHMGSGMMDGQGHHAEVEQHGMGMGGQPVSGGMMGGMHGGEPMGMMGADWSDPGDGHLGMAFDFTTS